MSGSNETSQPTTSKDAAVLRSSDLEPQRPSRGNEEPVIIPASSKDDSCGAGVRAMNDSTTDANTGSSTEAAAAGNGRMNAAQDENGTGAASEVDSVVESASEVFSAASDASPVPPGVKPLSGLPTPPLWSPGKPLLFAYITFNMANKKPRMEEISKHCILRIAHIIAVASQENGPYVGSNKRQNAWSRQVAQICLKNEYKLIKQEHMWATQLMVFARAHDVAPYVHFPARHHVKTGISKAGGNKGGVAVSFALRMLPLPPPPAQHTNPLLRSTEDFHSMSSTTLSYSRASDVASLRSRNSSAAVTRTHRASAPPEATQKAETAEAQRLLEQQAKEVTAAIFSTSQDNPGVEDLRKQLSRRVSTVSIAAAQPPISTPGALVVPPSLEKTASGRDKPPKAVAVAKEKTVPTHMTILVINSHLAAHQKKVERRNRDYHAIVSNLKVGTRGKQKKFHRRHLGGTSDKDQGPLDCDTTDDTNTDSESCHSTPSAPSQSFRNGHGRRTSRSSAGPNRRSDDDQPSQRHHVDRDVTDEFDLCFFGGDLNYRVDWQSAPFSTAMLLSATEPREVGVASNAVEFLLQHREKAAPLLLELDQLTLERAKGTVLNGFREAEIKFRPTYKFEINHNRYNFGKSSTKLPSYCDRVLFKHRRQSTCLAHVEPKLYTDVTDVTSSDHRPVVALFEIATNVASEM